MTLAAMVGNIVEHRGKADTGLRGPLNRQARIPLKTASRRARDAWSVDWRGRGTRAGDRGRWARSYSGPSATSSSGTD